ncbi:MAG: SPFH domain-containing protein [Nitrospinota bacterium]|nr:SPFH domain-containing protein [Nitrospinota bacterium]
MFGIQFVKAQPNIYFLQYRKGQIVREGAGLSFFYYAPVSSVVAIPMSSVDIPFIFKEVTMDFQEVTVQGQVAYRVRDPKKLAGLLNFTLASGSRDYVSDDPERLPQRIINQVQVLMRTELQKLRLKDALKSSEALVEGVRRGLAACELVEQLGIEVLALSVLAVKPNPETARALEAEVREQLLLEADDAIYIRRNAAVEQERTIKENELNTEIAVENKKRQIREAKIDADRAVQERRQAMEQEEMQGFVALEEKRKDLVELATMNKKSEADAQAYGMKALLDTFKNIDPKVMQVLGNVGMDPAQLIAGAFQNLADNADKIGNLNIAPELLQGLLSQDRIERRA